MKKLLFAPLAAMLALAACTNGPAYEVTMSVPEQMKGQTVALLNPMTGDTVNSIVANDTIIKIKGEIEEPTLVLAIGSGIPLAQMVLEPGKITVTDGIASGTASNDAYRDYADDVTALVEELNENPDAADSLIRTRLVPASVNFITANPNNPYNQAIFSDAAGYMDAQQLNRCMDADTILAANARVQHMLQCARQREKTDVGTKYVDLEILQEDSTMVRLSDYIKPGHYTLVDFWASWCQPCRREIPGLIELYNKYHAKGLDVVGVAVWDKTDDTRKAIEELNIKYPVILNGDATTTDAYGIVGIPCIMLIGPDGTILGRDLFGSEIAGLVESHIK